MVTKAKKTTAKKAPAKKTVGQTAGIEIPEIIRLLADSYGPFPQEPRLDPAHELTFTILSQHTSDINSERAFRGLMNRFGDLESVARAEVPDIELAIARGGLAKVKAPRIKQILNRILELNGSLDLTFLAEMPLPEAKAWLRQLPGIGPKSAGIVLSFSLGMPAMAIDTHIFRVCQRLGLIGPKVNADKAHDLMEEAVMGRVPGHFKPKHSAPSWCRVRDLLRQKSVALAAGSVTGPGGPLRSRPGPVIRAVRPSRRLSWLAAIRSTSAQA